MTRLVMSGQIGGTRRGRPLGGTITLPVGTRPPANYDPVPVGAQWTPAGSSRIYARRQPRSLAGTPRRT